MIIYIKNENGTIDAKSIAEITDQLTSTARSNEIDPYLIGYIPDSSAHFLFTIRQGELRRFGIRSVDVSPISQNKKTYYPIPAYHAYNISNHLFSPTPTQGRFTNDRAFTLDTRVFLTPEEIEQHCTPKIQLIHVTNIKSAQCPYLTNSILTEEQQRILYFSDVIKGCDRFQQTLLTIHENFDNPSKIFTAVITRESQLSAIALTPNEKKYIEMILLPFFQPEHINQIDKLDRVFIGDVLDFYFYAIKTELKKINIGFDIKHEKKYAQDTRNTLIGELSETYSSHEEYWCLPVKLDDIESIAANDAIFRFMSMIFGITTHNRDDELKILIRSQMECGEILPQKIHLLQAITDYCDTLSDTENTLHFSPRYQPAYDTLSVAYPIPQSQFIQSDILKKLKFTQSILENYDRVNDILHSNQSTLNSMDCVYLLNHLTKQEFARFLKNKGKQLSLTLTSAQDLQFIFTQYNEDQLNLILSYFLKELTLLIEINRDYFHCLLIRQAISREKKIIILSVLPIEIATHMLTSIITHHRAVFYDLISSINACKITQPLGEIEPEILSRFIVDADDFSTLFSTLTPVKRDIVYKQFSENHLLSIIKTINDFTTVFNLLEEKHVTHFSPNLIEKFRGLIKTMPDLQYIFDGLKTNCKDKLLLYIHNKLNTLIQNTRDLRAVLFRLDAIQTQRILPFIENSFSFLKTTTDFLWCFTPPFTQEKNIPIYEYLIAMRNRKLRGTESEYLFFPSILSELMMLLSILQLVHYNYDGKYHLEFSKLLTGIHHNENATLGMVLRQLKTLSGFDDVNRNGRLHNALMAIINAFEHKKEINVAHILELTKGSRCIPSCCTA